MRAAAEKFGRQCVVVAIDAKQVSKAGEPPRWGIFTHGGRRPTGIDAVDYAREVAALGAGEILLTSMDRDGTKTGFDIELTRAVADAVTVPVIASGGVGTLDHLVAGRPRGPRQRRAGGLDLPFRRIHHPPGQGTHGGGGHRDADGLESSVRSGPRRALRAAFSCKREKGVDALQRPAAQKYADSSLAVSSGGRCTSSVSTKAPLASIR